VFNPYPASYSWDSNQMAHAMMGFAGVVLLAQTGALFGLPLYCGALFAAFPLGKDVIDLWVDFGRKRKVVIYRRQRRHILAPLGDAAADQSFWWTGGALALFVLASTAGGDGAGGWALAAAVALLAAGLAIGLPFRAEKARFDKSGMPYYFRLPNLERGADPRGGPPPGPLTPEGFTRVVNDFIASREARHLAIVGPARTGRTLVSIGIGCDMLSIGHGTRVRYLRWSELGELAGEEAHTASGAQEPWALAEASVLIVDDTPLEADFTGLPASLFAARKVIWATSRAYEHDAGGGELDQLVGAIGNFLAPSGEPVGVRALVLGQPGDGSAGNEYQIRHGPAARLVAAVFVAVSAAALVAAIATLAWCGRDAGRREAGAYCEPAPLAMLAGGEGECRRCRLAAWIAGTLGG
jgi:hypothetical protein